MSENKNTCYRCGGNADSAEIFQGGLRLCMACGDKEFTEEALKSQPSGPVAPEIDRIFESANAERKRGEVHDLSEVYLGQAVAPEPKCPKCGNVNKGAQELCGHEWHWCHNGGVPAAPEPPCKQHECGIGDGHDTCKCANCGFKWPNPEWSKEEMCEGCENLVATRETDDMVRVCDECFALSQEEDWPPEVWLVLCRFREDEEWRPQDVYSDRRDAAEHARLRLEEAKPVGEEYRVARYLRAYDVAPAGGETPRLLHKANEPLPDGCYCKPGKCAAPVIMGQQMPCRDPQKAAGGGTREPTIQELADSYKRSSDFYERLLNETARALNVVVDLDAIPKAVKSALALLESERDKLRKAVQAYMFMEQTNGGQNPHRPGTNAWTAFELGVAALAGAPSPHVCNFREMLDKVLKEFYDSGDTTISRETVSAAYELLIAAGAPSVEGENE